MSLLKNQPQSLVDSAKALLDEFRSPLEESIQQWIKENRADYHMQYGMEEGERLLEARAWVIRKEASAKAHKKMSLSESVEEKKDDEENRLTNLHHAVTSQSGLPELGEQAQIEENYASSEPSSAIGFKDQNSLSHNPKHVDLIHDVSIIGGVRTDGYRLLLQYPEGPSVFWPPVEFPGAASVQSLWDLVAGLPDKYGAIQAAISTALDIPSSQPQFKGNDKK